MISRCRLGSVRRASAWRYNKSCSERRALSSTSSRKRCDVHALGISPSSGSVYTVRFVAREQVATSAFAAGAGVLAIGAGVGELRRHQRAGARRRVVRVGGEGHPEEHAVVVRVDHPVVVRIAEELNPIQELTIARKRRLPAHAGQVQREPHGRRVALEAYGLERGRGARGKPRPHVLRHAVERDVHEPTPVG